MDARGMMEAHGGGQLCVAFRRSRSKFGMSEFAGLGVVPH